MKGWSTYSVLAVLASLSACGGGQAECGAAECADVCARSAPAPAPAAPEPARAEPAPAAGAGMTAFEKQLVGPLMDDLRAGVRPFDEQGIGICKGAGKECGTYLGTDVGELPAGEYSLQARLKVPDIGEKGTWTVKLLTQCETVSDDGSVREGTPYERSYDVIYAGADKGYTLAPLYKITSPAGSKAKRCTYTITAPHPDGDKVYDGSWSVPAEG